MVVVLAIGSHVVPPSVELSHCVTLPVLPVKPNVPLTLLQEETEAGKEPPTVIGLTVTVSLAVLIQPVPSVDVAVTVYIVVILGLAVTVEPVVADNPVEGLHA